MADTCAHQFKRRRWWFLRSKCDRYVCLRCGLITRYWNAVDRWAWRPVHRHMSVALRGVNFHREGADG